MRPAIGVSLLKGHLKRMNVASRVEYLNLRFAELIGEELYQYIADEAPSWSLLGEWVFAPCLFDACTRDPDGYFRMLATRSRAGRAAGDKRDAILGAREAAPAYVDECLQRIDWAAYDLVGFTTTFTQNLASLALARRVRERFPDLTIVFGGANCEGEMGLQLHRSFLFIDFAFSGEADVSFPQLIRCLQTGGDVHGIRGVVSRRDGATHCVNLLPERVRDLDTLPYPSYEDFFEQYADRHLQTGRRSVSMETSRGCWWGEKQHCTFCGLNGLSMTYRAKSPTRALDEMIALTDRYGTRNVDMVDNILDMNYFHQLLPELKERQMSLDLFYEIKANLSRAQVQLLRDAGIRHLQPGIESFSTHVLRLMRKGTSAIQNVQLLKWCKGFGITCHWNLLYGFPGEKPADYDEMVALMESLHHLDPPSSCGLIRLDRFSPHFMTPEQSGFCDVRPDRAYGYLYDLPGEEVRNIAYYFEYDYLDGRDPRGYTSALDEAVRRWKDDARTSGLVYTDDGTTLTIQDFRVNAVQHRTTLRGAEREVYLYCDQNRSLQQITVVADQVGKTERETVTFLRKMVELRLLATADGRYLSLAVSAVASPKESTTREQARALMTEEELVELSRKLEVWSEELSSEQRTRIKELLGPALTP